MEHMFFKGLMIGSLGVTFVMLAFMAPSGAMLTTSASPERVERKAGGKPGKHRTRGPRYVFIGGYYGGK
jgi:hypothetical protein